MLLLEWVQQWCLCLIDFRHWSSKVYLLSTRFHIRWVQFNVVLRSPTWLLQIVVIEIASLLWNLTISDQYQICVQFPALLERLKQKVISLVFSNFTECFNFTTTHLLFCVCVLIGPNSTLIYFSLWFEVLAIDNFLWSLIKSDDDLTRHSWRPVYYRISSCKTLWRRPLHQRSAIRTISNWINRLELSKAPLLLYLCWFKHSLSLLDESVRVHQVSYVVDHEDHGLDSQH